MSFTFSQCQNAQHIHIAGHFLMCTTTPKTMIKQKKERRAASKQWSDEVKYYKRNDKNKNVTIMA